MVFIIIAAFVLLLIMLYVYAIFPEKKDIEQLKNWYYSHRGLHDLDKGIAENTIPAFKRAVDEKYGIELDVHLSSDEKVVVFHDDDLKNASGADVRISDAKYEEIKKYKLFSTDEVIPLFTDVLEIVDGKVPLIIELKNCKNYTRLCEKVCEILANYNGDYCIESFNPNIVKWFRKNRPDIIRGQLSASFLKGNSNMKFITRFILTYMLTNLLGRPHFIAYVHNYKKNLSLVICRKLFKANTVAWTIRSKEELENASNMFDLFIFEGFIP